MHISTPRYILAPEDTSTTYTNAGDLLVQLNKSFGTNILISYSGLADALKHLINEKHDFGAIYARLRALWPSSAPGRDTKSCNIWKELQKVEESVRRHERMRHDSIKNNGIIQNAIHIPPRRIWDLYAHRVIPYEYESSNLDVSPKNIEHLFKKDSELAYYNFFILPASISGHRIKRNYVAVSHSWVKNPKPIFTNVNARQWPVCLPNDVTLEDVRNQLLDLGAEFVWLDILCLRQVSNNPDHEILRENEWTIDIPTIGYIYRHSKNVMRYFNGLGREFNPCGWKDKCHWTQRASTLQECCWNETINVGDDPSHPIIKRKAGDDPNLVLEELIGFSRYGEFYNILTLTSLMAKRHAYNPVDRVSGLTSLLCTDSLPTYSLGEAEEDAWVRLLDHIPFNQHKFLVFSPYIGDGCCSWHPSWAQVMGMKTDKTKTPSHASFSGKFHVLENCQVSPTSNGGYRIQYRQFTFSANLISGAVDKGEYTVLQWGSDLCGCRQKGGRLQKVAKLVCKRGFYITDAPPKIVTLC